MPQVQPHFRLLGRQLGRKVFARTALGVSLAVLVLCATTAARAGDSDEGGPSVLGSIMKSMGFKNSDSGYDGIDYNERSPLVVPPSRELPSPANANAVPAPNWPKDQDIERRNKAKAEAKKITPHPDYVSDSSRPLRPNELDAPGAPRISDPAGGGSTANSLMADPRDRGAKKSLFSGLFTKKEDYTTFTGEPSRSALTDPPPGYLTPSPDQPYGVGQAPSSYKIKTLGERVEPTR